MTMLFYKVQGNTSPFYDEIEHKLSKHGLYVKVLNIGKTGPKHKLVLKKRFFTRNVKLRSGSLANNDDGSLEEYYHSPWHSVCAVCDVKYWPKDVVLIFDDEEKIDDDFIRGRPVCNNCVNKLGGIK